MIRALKILNLVFFLLMIGVNVLANILPFGIGTTKDISDKYTNLFTPAPITFSIWGLIYLLVFLFILYQLSIFNNKELARVFVDLIGPWFIISCIMNIGFIFSWHYDVIWLSVLFIVGLLLSLIVITTNIYPNNIESNSGLSSLPMFANTCIIAFDIYIGWITAATIANISVLLVKNNWNRFGLSSQFWMIAVLIIGALIGILFIAIREKYFSALAIIWAYCGILIKHISQSGYKGEYPLIIAVCIICIVLILSTGLIKMIITKNSFS